MSLDCYPLAGRRWVELTEQPLALDVAYNDDLLITSSDQCRTISVHDLTCEGQGHLYRRLSLSRELVLDQVVYCRTGDYIACSGDRNGLASVQIILGWRRAADQEPDIIELDLNSMTNNPGDADIQLNSIDCCQRTGNLAVNMAGLVLIYKYSQEEEVPFRPIISVRPSIAVGKINLLENYLSMTSTDHVQVLKLELNSTTDIVSSTFTIYDSITWNLNTKKLVKLPTLMHNTSSNLSSYHICHPLELLGPASESIACRVSVSIHSPDFSQNQLEAVVMLCKQLDFDRDPVKSTHLQAVYLSSLEDQRRISKSASAMMDHDSGCDEASGSGPEATLLKSADYELLASVTCYVSTLASCFVYSLQGNKVTCSQTITHPDLCLDLRPDLLNVYLLTPLGLQICSSGICDSSFRYDWSSSSNLNLSFIALNRMRVLTTRRFVILVACSEDGHQCQVEYLEKPDLAALSDRIVDTVNHCNSISIRANLLTYLHASSHLALMASDSDESSSRREERRQSIVSKLKSITITLCKQLLQKRQTNAITNNRIDKAIKHLLDISMCDLAELMRRHMQSDPQKQSDDRADLFNSSESALGRTDSSDVVEAQSRRRQQPRSLCLQTRSTLEDNDSSSANRPKSINSTTEEHDADYERLFLSSDDDDDQTDKPLDADYELIRIHLKHSKYGQWLLDYLVSISRDEDMIRRVIDYLFEHNPRLLIKCAQKYPLIKDDQDCQVASSSPVCPDYDKKIGRSAFCMKILVDKLEQLAEFDSTGINRATVLFTLAALYNALEERQKCLGALGQIKPLNHLAITMCSNQELSQSMVGVVSENYPEVHALYLGQQSKCDRFANSMQQLDREHR